MVLQWEVFSASRSAGKYRRVRALRCGLALLQRDRTAPPPVRTYGARSHMTIHYLTAILPAFVAVSGTSLMRLAGEKKCGIAERVISLLFAALFFAGYLYDADAISGVYAPGQIPGVQTVGRVGALALSWLTVAGGLFIAVYPFFRKACPWTDVLTVLPVAAFLLDLIFLNDYVALYTGKALSEGVTARSALLAAGAGVGFAASVYYFIWTVRGFGAYKKQLGWIALALLGILLCSAPNYTLQLLLRPADYAMKVIDLNMWHRIYIYPMVLIPVALAFIAGGKDAETKRLVLIYYSLAALWQFMYFQKIPMIWGISHLGNLPFHLCNTALYILPLCLIFRMKRLFYFTYFINVLGAFFAIMMPNYGLSGLGGSMIVAETLRFFRSHYQAFFMPLLCVGFGVFERPRLRQFIYSLIGFAVYYLFVLILNSWFTNYGSVDFFFINSDFVAEKLGTWAERLRDVVFSFNAGGLTFTFYPLYQVIYFFVYCLLALAMWFLYELSYKSVDGWKDLAARRKKIKMDALAREYTKEGGIPMYDDKALLSVENFSKRYGKSDVYAAYRVGLEVHGGEIFGFLGPNGAGKSTIIKSIVGIQPVDEGTISVCGYDVKRQSVQAKRQIGFVPDHYALYERLTGREYVNYIADLYEIPKKERDERLDGYLEIFEMKNAFDDPISTYSHGMKQKVAIMAALVHDPKVWILDEPLTGLDPNSIYQVKECMRKHAAAGNVVFFSSHLIEVVERICDRIAIIRKGQIQCVCSVEEVEKTSTLEEFYLGVIGEGEVAPVPFERKKA